MIKEMQHRYNKEKWLFAHQMETTQTTGNATIEKEEKDTHSCGYEAGEKFPKHTLLHVLTLYTYHFCHKAFLL